MYVILIALLAFSPVFFAQTTTGSRVSGRVIQFGSQPVLPAGLPIVLDHHGVGHIAETPLRADGTFEFTNVRPGTYDIVLHRPVGSIESHASARFYVEAKDITNLELLIPPMFEVQGRIVVEDGGPLPADPSYVGFIGGPGNAENAQVLPDGTFKVALREDAYRLTYDPRGGVTYVVRSIAYGSVNLLQEKLRVGGGESSTILITLGQ